MAAHVTTLFGDEIIPKVTPDTPEVAPMADSGLSQKQYATIGEVAATFGVRTSHIRFWTTEFGLKVRTTQRGDRLYTPANIATLRTIYHLVKERGFTIAGAKAKLAEDSGASADVAQLKESLLQLRNQLVSIRNSLS